MMKFRFSYESLLGHRKLEEEVARRDFNEAFRLLEEQKEEYRKMYATLHGAEAESFSLQGSQERIQISKLIELGDFMVGQKIKIAKQREIVINHTQIVEGKQEILIKAAKETMILEKLKEKQFGIYKKAVAKKEAKMTDEIVVTRFKAGGRA